MDRIFVVMRRDELGDEKRAYGSEALEKEYHFQDFSEEDEIMWDTFLVWQDLLQDKLQEEWDSTHESGECCIFLEEKHSSRFARIYGEW